MIIDISEYFSANLDFPFITLYVSSAGGRPEAFTKLDTVFIESPKDIKERLDQCAKVTAFTYRGVQSGQIYCYFFSPEENGYLWCRTYQVIDQVAKLVDDAITEV